MDVDQIKAALTSALPLRPPKFEKDTPPRAKIEALEDYLLQSAYAQAELEEALHWIDALVAHFTAKVEQITGYELALPRKPRDRITQADVNVAKRTIDPTTFELGAEMKQLRASVIRQIDRFRFEAGNGPVSRAYTLISGG